MAVSLPIATENNHYHRCRESMNPDASRTDDGGTTMRVCLGRLLLVCVLFVTGIHAGSAQGRRVALVIGNSAYRAAPQLPNPANDARLLAQTLAALGFTLIGGGAQLNLGKSGFDAAVEDFGQALKGAEVALFYYAGHGMQIQGTNWLVPLDANPSRPKDLDTQMVDASRVLKQMEAAKTKLNVLILDACRNNPFTGIRPNGGETGLAQMLPMQGSNGPALRGSATGLAQMGAPEGTVIAFATQPGNVARDGSGANSPYTLALAEAMRQKGLNVLSMFNRVGVDVKRSTSGAQQPWVSNSPIEGEYFFAGLGLGAVPTASVKGHATSDTGHRASDGLRERIVVKAQAENIPVPSNITIELPAASVPKNVAQFIGVWGPGQWLYANRSPFPDHQILAVTSVDAEGNAAMVSMESGGCGIGDCSMRRPVAIHFNAKIENGKLTWRAHKAQSLVTFEVSPDGQLLGTKYHSPTGYYYVRLPRLE